MVSQLPVLGINEDVDDLADLYFRAIELPQKARADAYHLALATWHGMDYLATWNCAHIASGRVRRIIERLNTGRRIVTPVVCTPEELMEV